MIEPERLKNQSGQAMLLIVLIVTLALSIIGAVVFDSLTQSQITKLQEDSARALAVADGLAEQALRLGDNVSISTGEDALINQGTAVIDKTASNSFTTPVLSKDDIYIVYLSELGDKVDDIIANIRRLITGASGPSSVSRNISISVANSEDFGGQSCPFGLVLELGFIKLGSSIDRTYNIIKCEIGSDYYENLASDDMIKSMGDPFVTPQAHLLVIRVLYKPSGSSSFPGIILKIDSASPLPLQGITVNSSVRTTSGVTQSLTVFQSYPQIATSFLIPNINDN